jgi:hypothetical protein
MITRTAYYHTNDYQGFKNDFIIKVSICKVQGTDHDKKAEGEKISSYSSLNKSSRCSNVIERTFKWQEKVSLKLCHPKTDNVEELGMFRSTGNCTASNCCNYCEEMET